MRRIAALVVVLCAAVVMAYTQDPVRVDAKHYKVVFENDKVRVLQISYGPKEKSVMHEHPASVAVFLTGGHANFTFPDGKVEHQTMNVGDSRALPAGKHLPENVGDKPFEVLLVELKVKVPPPPPAKAAPPKK
jgi:quercetin dioxygenase-like cupin family protein